MKNMVHDYLEQGDPDQTSLLAPHLTIGRTPLLGLFPAIQPFGTEKPGFSQTNLLQYPEPQRTGRCIPDTGHYYHNSTPRTPIAVHLFNLAQ